MRQFLLLSALLLCCTPDLAAQDPAVFNHYVQSPIILNPAAAGFNDEFRFMLNTRAAWAGFDGAPQTLALRANGPIAESFGIGLTYVTESAAQRTRNKGQVDVAFKLAFGRDEQGEPTFRGALGFFTEYQRFTLDAGVLDNPLVDMSDPRLMEALGGENQFDAGVGFYGAYRQNTFGGVTINNLVANRLEDISGRTINEGVNFTFLLGHTFRPEGGGISITPSLMMRDVQYAPFMLDVNVQAAFVNEQVVAGLSYRNLGAVGLLLGAQVNGIRAYYAFDLGLGGLEDYSSGSHELTLGYAITRGRVLAGRERRTRRANANPR